MPEAAAVAAGRRLTILMGDDEVWHRRPLFEEIVRRARQSGLAGVTVLPGIEGFGVGGRVHTNRILSPAEDLPVQVIVVDEMEGLILLDRVGVVGHLTGTETSD